MHPFSVALEEPATPTGRTAVPQGDEPALLIPVQPTGTATQAEAQKRTAHPKDRTAVESVTGTKPEEGGTPASPDHGPVKPLFPPELQTPGGRPLGLVERTLQAGGARPAAPGTQGAPWYNAPLYSDPLFRAATLGVAPFGETLVDGFGSLVGPPGSELFGPAIPEGARIFRLGPASIRGALNFGADYRYFDGDLRNAGVGVSSAASLRENPAGKRNSKSYDELAAVGGMHLDILIGEPATGHFLSILYGFVVSERTAGTNQEPLEQSLSLLGRLDFAQVKIALGVSFASLSGVSRDLGQQTNRTLLTTDFSASCLLSPKLSLDWDIGIPIKEVEGGINTATFSSTHVISFAYDPKVVLGIGIGYGVESNTASSEFRAKAGVGDRADRSQRFARLITRATFQPHSKLAFHGEFGGEYREEDDGSTLQPIMNWGVAWSPRQTTSVSFGMQQTFGASAAMAGQNFLSTAAQIGLSQQLAPRLGGVLSVGYEHADYMSTGKIEDVSLPGGNRVDDLFTVRVGVSLALSSRWSATLSYQYSNNSSSRQEFVFSSSQVQLQTSVAF